MARKYHELAFTPAVLAAQERYFGRSRPVVVDHQRDCLGTSERAFIAARDSFYMATVTENGWPYLQHRGGAPGFVKVLDESTLAFADYQGNRQMISVGSLDATDRVSLFFMDYPNRARLKLFGHARVEDAGAHPELLQRIADAEVRPIVERLFIVNVVSFDWNCPKYITPRFTAAEIEEVIGPLRAYIGELETRLAAVATESTESKQE
jgi:predicted pyridoxine 5'-phosphate oxidase superfamily flavin-nucleotide-binding protein